MTKIVIDLSAHAYGGTAFARDLVFEAANSPKAQSAVQFGWMLAVPAFETPIYDNTETRTVVIFPGEPPQTVTVYDISVLYGDRGSVVRSPETGEIIAIYPPTAADGTYAGNFRIPVSSLGAPHQINDLYASPEARQAAQESYAKAIATWNSGLLQTSITSVDLTRVLSLCQSRLIMA